MSVAHPYGRFASRKTSKSAGSSSLADPRREAKGRQMSLKKWHTTITFDRITFEANLVNGAPAAADKKKVAAIRAPRIDFAFPLNPKRSTETVHADGTVSLALKGTKMGAMPLGTPNDGSIATATFDETSGTVNVSIGGTFSQETVIRDDSEEEPPPAAWTRVATAYIGVVGFADAKGSAVSLKNPKLGVEESVSAWAVGGEQRYIKVPVKVELDTDETRRLKASLAKAPKNAKLCLEVADAYDAIEGVDDDVRAAHAAAFIARAVELGDESDETLERLSGEYWACSDWSSLCKTLELRARKRPDDADICEKLGLALLNQSNVADAKIWFRKARALDPSALQPAQKLAVIAIEEGALDEARALIRALRENEWGVYWADVYEKELAKAEKLAGKKKPARSAKQIETPAAAAPKEQAARGKVAVVSKSAPKTTGDAKARPKPVSDKVSAKSARGATLPAEFFAVLLLDMLDGPTPHSDFDGLEDAVDAAFGSGASERLMFAQPFSGTFGEEDYEIPLGYLLRAGSPMAGALARIKKAKKKGFDDSAEMGSAEFTQFLEAVRTQREPKFVFFDARDFEVKHIDPSGFDPSSVEGVLFIQCSPNDE
jgi:hypothetical protein